MAREFHGKICKKGAAENRAPLKFGKAKLRSAQDGLCYKKKSDGVGK